VTTVLERSDHHRNYWSLSVSASSRSTAFDAASGTVAPSVESSGLAFNFQWAWSSGTVAGRAAVKS
ncbi:MAG: hypothetical protein RLZZ53_2571, partial [Acidobacteriota bacterium]